MESNRDYKRQNKATTVVDATIYSLVITDDSVKGIISLAESQLSNSESSSNQGV